MSFEIFTCCLFRAYTAMEKYNNARLYAVHVQPPSWSELAPLRPSGLGNWSHPLPLVSAWLAVVYSQRAAATLSSLDQLSAAWWSATGCALLSIQSTKIAQKLTVSLDFRSTAGWYIDSIWFKPTKKMEEHLDIKIRQNWGYAYAILII